MRGLNKVTLIGNLGSNPEIKVLDGRKKYVTEIIAESFIMLDKGADKAEINASF